MAPSQEAAVSIGPVPPRDFNIVAANASAYHANAEAFRRVFGHPLRNFWPHNVTGLDITKLDEEVVKSGDRAIGDVVKERFGPEGVQIIHALLPVDPHAPPRRRQSTAEVVQKLKNATQLGRALGRQPWSHKARLSGKDIKAAAQFFAEYGHLQELERDLAREQARAQTAGDPFTQSQHQERAQVYAQALKLKKEAA